MKLKTSVLQLKELQIEKFEIEENIHGINKFILNADFTPIESSKGDEKYRGFRFKLTVNYRVKNPALKSRIELAVLFDIDKNLTEKEQVRLILYNGLSIIYGMMRGMIFQACSILPPDMKALPSINLVDFIDFKLKHLEED